MVFDEYNLTLGNMSGDSVVKQTSPLLLGIYVTTLIFLSISGLLGALLVYPIMFRRVYFKTPPFRLLINLGLTDQMNTIFLGLLHLPFIFFTDNEGLNGVLGDINRIGGRVGVASWYAFDIHLVVIAVNRAIYILGPLSWRQKVYGGAKIWIHLAVPHTVFLAYVALTTIDDYDNGYAYISSICISSFDPARPVFQTWFTYNFVFQIAVAALSGTLYLVVIIKLNLQGSKSAFRIQFHRNQRRDVRKYSFNSFSFKFSTQRKTMRPINYQTLKAETRFSIQLALVYAAFLFTVIMWSAYHKMITNADHVCVVGITIMLSISINSTINPWIYLWINRRLRREVVIAISQMAIRLKCPCITEQYEVNAKPVLNKGYPLVLKGKKAAMSSRKGCLTSSNQLLVQSRKTDGSLDTFI